MLDKEPRLRTILGVNLRLAHATVLLFFGWACWQWTSKEWWGVGIAAMLCLAGGVIEVIATVHRIVAILTRDRKIKTFTSQGAAARADRMAGERDLRDRGMIR